MKVLKRENCAIAVKTDYSTGGSHNHIRKIALDGQGVSSPCFVECSVSDRVNYPIGTTFVIKAKLTDRQGTPFIYSYYSWPCYHINGHCCKLSQEAAFSLIQSPNNLKIFPIFFIFNIFLKIKKIFIFLGLMFVMLSSTYAQKGRQAIGFGLSYGTEIESAGLGIKYQYNITNPLRIEPSFNYFFENDNVSMLDLNVNFHYLCPVAQSVKLYPLFGLTMSNWMFDMHDLDVDWDGDHVHVDDGGNHNEFRIGVNLGAGAEFALGRNWAMNVEFRYQLVDDFDQGVINFGAAYRF